MRKIVLLLALSAAGAFAADGWHPLFNGKNLDGWAIADAQGHAAYTVENGAIRTQPGQGLLWYPQEKIGNATLRVVYKMSDDHGNSGIFIRIPSAPPNESFAANHGIEVQIDDRDNDWHCTGVLYSMTKALARPSKPAGEWNTLDITMEALRTTVRLNGMLVTDYDGASPVPRRTKSYEPLRGPRPEYGDIALQHHDDRATIYFKEVSVKPLVRH